MGDGIAVRPLREPDLPEADRICRIAFGTWLGAPEPERFFGDTEIVRTRWRADPGGAVAGDIDGRLAGSSFAARWGSIGVLGPVSVAPEHWDRSLGQRLVEASMALFDGWDCRLVGLMTFADSAKHVALYQKYGFWPRELVAIMSREVGPEPRGGGEVRLSELKAGDLGGALADIRDLTDAVLPGLDLTVEIRSVLEQRIGEVVLLEDGGRAGAFAVCHLGAGSEAGGGHCYVKFGAARPGDGAAARFDRLLDACHDLARARDLSTVTAGVNGAREEAWRRLRAGGFRVGFQSVAMHRPNQPGYNKPGSFVIDDWR